MAHENFCFPDKRKTEVFRNVIFKRDDHNTGTFIIYLDPEDVKLGSTKTTKEGSSKWRTYCKYRPTKKRKRREFSSFDKIKRQIQNTAAS